MSTTVAPASSTTTNTTSGIPSTLTNDNTTVSEDRFLKLLVAQMQNQDPLNPLDNAEVTSQMAQINTVTGLDKLNTTVQGLNTQFVQMQAMQGAALVGREVAVEGDSLRVDSTGKIGDGGFELASAADKVKVEILGPGDKVIGTLDLGAQAAGRHTFQWDVPDAYKGNAMNFRVTATSGATDVTAMPLAHQTISAVSTFGSTFALELANGERVSYDAVWAFL